jgi:hypothetical protein
MQMAAYPYIESLDWLTPMILPAQRDSPMDMVSSGTVRARTFSMLETVFGRSNLELHSDFCTERQIASQPRAEAPQAPGWEEQCAIARFFRSKFGWLWENLLGLLREFQREHLRSMGCR